MKEAKKGRKQKRQIEAKGKEATKAPKAIKQPKERRTFIGSLINADLWQRMKMLSLKEGKAAGKLLDHAMEEFLKKKEGNRKIPISNEKGRLKAGKKGLFGEREGESGSKGSLQFEWQGKGIDFLLILYRLIIKIVLSGWFQHYPFI